MIKDLQHLTSILESSSVVCVRAQSKRVLTCNMKPLYLTSLMLVPQQAKLSMGFFLVIKVISLW